jgi:UDP-N-acetylmuramate--alanine ligase
MRGLAVLLAGEGYRLTGSDRDPDAAVSLEAIGIRVFSEEDPRPVREAELVVFSSALAHDHPALEAARAAGVPTLKRATAMGALVNDRRLAAVAGTHGKTTLTAMLALLAEAGGLRPSALVGGTMPAWRANARVGEGELAVVEADEYDRSFLELDPELAVVTSVEPEHLECYDDFADLRASFVRFAGRAACREGALVCADSESALEIGANVGAHRSYGFAPTADYRVQVVDRRGSGQRCLLEGPEGGFVFELGTPGDHNAQNACGALAAALLLGVSPEPLGDTLSGFRGVERRLQILTERNGRAVVDDYAHHPTEVLASIAALRASYPGLRLAVVFQPHLYSRTRALAPDFAEALATADVAFVLPVYPAREQPIAGVDSGLIVRGAPDHVREAGVEEVEAWLEGESAGLVVAFMGAGDVTELAHRAAGEMDEDALEG